MQDEDKFCKSCGTENTAEQTQGFQSSEALPTEQASSDEQNGHTYINSSSDETYSNQTNSTGSTGASYAWNGEKHSVNTKKSAGAAGIVLTVIFSLFLVGNIFAAIWSAASYSLAGKLNADNISDIIYEIRDASGGYDFFSDSDKHYNDGTNSYSAFGTYRGDTISLSNGAAVETASYNHYNYDEFFDDFGYDYDYDDYYYDNDYYDDYDRYGYYDYSDEFMNSLRGFDGFSADQAVSINATIALVKNAFLISTIFFVIMCVVFTLGIFFALRRRASAFLTPGIIFAVLGAINAFIAVVWNVGINSLLVAAQSNFASLIGAAGSFGNSLLISSAVTGVVGIILILVSVFCKNKDND